MVIGDRSYKLEEKSDERRPKTGDEPGAVRRGGQCGRNHDRPIRRRDRGDGGGAASASGD